MIMERSLSGQENRFYFSETPRVTHAVDAGQSSSPSLQMHGMNQSENKDTNNFIGLFLDRATSAPPPGYSSTPNGGHEKTWSPLLYKMGDTGGNLRSSTVSLSSTTWGNPNNLNRHDLNGATATFSPSMPSYNLCKQYDTQPQSASVHFPSVMNVMSCGLGRNALSHSNLMHEGFSHPSDGDSSNVTLGSSKRLPTRFGLDLGQQRGSEPLQSYYDSRVPTLERHSVDMNRVRLGLRRPMSTGITDQPTGTFIPWSSTSVERQTQDWTEEAFMEKSLTENLIPDYVPLAYDNSHRNNWNTAVEDLPVYQQESRISKLVVGERNMSIHSRTTDSVRHSPPVPKNIYHQNLSRGMPGQDRDPYGNHPDTLQSFPHSHNIKSYEKRPEVSPQLHMGSHQQSVHGIRGTVPNFLPLSRNISDYANVEASSETLHQNAMQYQFIQSDHRSAVVTPSTQIHASPSSRTFVQPITNSVKAHQAPQHSYVIAVPVHGNFSTGQATAASTAGTYLLVQRNNFLPLNECMSVPSESVSVKEPNVNNTPNDVHFTSRELVCDKDGRHMNIVAGDKNSILLPDKNDSSSSSKSKRTNTRRSEGAISDGKKSSTEKVHSLLEKLRPCKNSHWTSYDFKDNILDLCLDQHGSRFIQQRMEVADEAEKEMILEQVLPSMRRLRNDVFGNYVVQKLFENGTKSMKSTLKQTLQNDVVPLSKLMYGCRVVQKALECLEDDDLPSLLAEFRGNVIECINDQNGNHVIQKCIEVIMLRAKAAQNVGNEIGASQFRSDIQFIIDASLESIHKLSCHPYGCRVIQRILEYCIDPNATRALEEVRKIHHLLLDDQYGNYVIQHVLQFGRKVDRENILNTVLQSGLLTLSRQKYASNVVEKLLKYGNAGVRSIIIREMLKEDDKGNGDSIVLHMVRDAFANYVVQTAIDVVSEGQEKRRLLEELNRHSSQLRNYTFAKHIISKIGSSS